QVMHYDISARADGAGRRENVVMQDLTPYCSSVQIALRAERAAGERGPLLTAAAAKSSWARSEQPMSTVDRASPVMAKRSAASTTLAAWPWATSGSSARARLTSVA